MLFKFVRQTILMARGPQKTVARRVGDLIPPSQYDIPLSPKFQMGYALKVYWELVPVVVTTAISGSLAILAILWAIAHKVDVTYTTHSRASISRVMDLRNPSIHKIIIVNQRYLPWPELQIVLDKMTTAEKRALSRMQSCNHP